jgi:hypothetical protein
MDDDITVIESIKKQNPNHDNTTNSCVLCIPMPIEMPYIGHEISAESNENRVVAGTYCFTSYHDVPHVNSIVHVFQPKFFL